MSSNPTWDEDNYQLSLPWEILSVKSAKTSYTIAFVQKMMSNAVISTTLRCDWVHKNPFFVDQLKIPALQFTNTHTWTQNGIHSYYFLRGSDWGWYNFLLSCGLQGRFIFCPFTHASGLCCLMTVRRNVHPETIAWRSPRAKSWPATCQTDCCL